MTVAKVTMNSKKMIKELYLYRMIVKKTRLLILTTSREILSLSLKNNLIKAIKGSAVCVTTVL